jgi:hypothetical protein
MLTGSLRVKGAKRFPPENSMGLMAGWSRVDDASSVHRPAIDKVDKKSVVHPT